jgi:thiol-disulfide isomerase/thioredoxin
MKIKNGRLIRSIFSNKMLKRTLFLIITLTIFLLVTFQAETIAAGNNVELYLFWGYGCPHCENEKVFLEKLQQKYPQLAVNSYEVWRNRGNALFFSQMAEAYGAKATAVPMTFIGNFEPIVGYSNDKVTGKKIEEKVKYCIEHECVDPLSLLSEPERKETVYDKEESKIITLPVFGKIDSSNVTLPILTLILAGLDSFNPCAFFVLFLLLGILVYARSRKRMLLIGGTFVFFSGFIYFIFMSAWLNLFLYAGQLKIITKIAGFIALVIAVINIKDFFIFKKGISLSVPEKAKPKLFERIRNLLKATSLPSMMIGAIVLAIAANTYELLCTVGFPIVFTRILTLNNLMPLEYYLYLIFYNVIYVIPLGVVVLVFAITLGSKKLTEWQGQILKLISGLMMLGLGGILLIDPDLFNNLLVSIGLLLIALITSGIIILITKILRKEG